MPHLNPVSAADDDATLGRLRLIILSASREYMGVLRRLLAANLPEIEVTEYDTEQKGRPGDDFDWAVYDAVLIDHAMGDGHDALEWLGTLGQRHGFPPIILMAADGGEYLAARAIKLGAHDYINKQDITSERIGRMVAAAVAETRVRPEDDATLREEHVPPHLAILERIAERAGIELEPGDPSVGYRFVRLIGQGASSRVYLAERTTDDLTLVLKVIDATTIQDVQLVERFLREADIVQTLDSPYVVRFFDHGLTQSYGFIAMEFFTRGDLKQRLERGVSATDALVYARHIAMGLKAIHDRGIIHRDLKPGNIMFRADDSLALGDFGIAKRMAQPSDLTNHGCVLGTPNYLSPEQALGEPVDQRADLYSVGVILFEMLTGRKPFRADSAAALVYQHVHAPIPPLPPEHQHCQPLLDRLLAKDPAERFANATELALAIRELQQA
ncbi:MAG: protein kinase domain-containing protein [Gammaproteobacteria bacterium]